MSKLMGNRKAVTLSSGHSRQLYLKVAASLYDNRLWEFIVGAHFLVKR